LKNGSVENDTAFGRTGRFLGRGRRKANSKVASLPWNGDAADTHKSRLNKHWDQELGLTSGFLKGVFTAKRHRINEIFPSFGTRGSEVQILSPRPMGLITFSGLLKINLPTVDGKTEL